MLIYLAAPAQQKEILSDDFSSNKNKWPEDSVGNFLKKKIENGKFIITNQGGQVETSGIAVGVDSTKYFSISVSASFASTSKYENNMIGMFFSSNYFNEYDFLITTGGKWKLLQYENGKEVKIAEQPCKYINTSLHTGNRLRMEKNESTWNFFINDSAVYTIPARKYYGHYAGLYCYYQLNAEFKDFKVIGTPLNLTGNLCTLLPVLFQSGKDNFSYLLGNPNGWFRATKFKSLLKIKNDTTALITIEDYGGNNEFKCILKTCKTFSEASKQLDLILAEIKNCLKDYTVEKNSVDGKIYIHEKNNFLDFGKTIESGYGGKDLWTVVLIFSSKKVR